MVRTAPRGKTTAPEVELLDRTGIVAASLPQRRRPVLGRSPLDGRDQHDKDWDLRPKSVVIQRRIKAWLGTSGAVALVMTGWITGGAFDGPETQTAAPAPIEIREQAAQPVQPAQPAPPPVEIMQPPNPGPAPVPVAKKPAAPKQVAARTPNAAKKPPPKSTPTVAPRLDTPAPPKAKDPVEEFMQAYADQFVKTRITIVRG